MAYNKRYTLRRLFGGSGFEKPQSGDTPFVRFCLTHIPARLQTLRLALLGGQEHRIHSTHCTKVQLLIVYNSCKYLSHKELALLVQYT